MYWIPKDFFEDNSLCSDRFLYFQGVKTTEYQYLGAGNGETYDGWRN